MAEVQGELFGATFVAVCGMYGVLLSCMLVDGLLVPDETEARFDAQFKKFLKSLTNARSVFSRFRWPMLPTLLYQASLADELLLVSLHSSTSLRTYRNQLYAFGAFLDSNAKC